jgi:threonine dehydrogenase-like Zn-dependent dehydrogenase
LTIGHEPVGVIEKAGSAVKGFREGQRVIAGAITPSGHASALDFRLRLFDLLSIERLRFEGAYLGAKGFRGRNGGALAGAATG